MSGINIDENKIVEAVMKALKNEIPLENSSVSGVQSTSPVSDEDLVDNFSYT